jgi:hypothetical protein
MKALRVSPPAWIALGLCGFLALGLGAPVDPAHGQCNEPALTSGQLYYLPHGTTARIQQGVSYWTAIGVRPASTSDWDLALYSAAGPAPTCASGFLASSVAGGSATDIVVGDFNHNLHGEYRARVYQYSGTDPWAQVEWDDGVDVLQVNGFETYKSTSADDIVDCYDVFLTAGTTYTFNFNQYTSANGMRMLVFRNPSSSAYWAGRSARVLELAGPGTYTAPADDWYGVVVVNDAAEHGAYTLGVGVCLAPVALSGGVVQGVSSQQALKSMNQSAPYFTAVGVRGDDPTDDWELRMYASPGGSSWPVCASNMLAASVFADGLVEFVVGDFNGGSNVAGTYYPQPALRGVIGQSPAKVEWDSGPDQLAVNAVPISRTTGPNDILECWDIFLPGPRDYSLVLEHDGPAALRAFVFRNPGAAYWVGRDGAHASGSESFAFSAPAGDWYGVVVVNDNGQAGNYRIAVSECGPYPVLASGVPLSTTASVVEIRPTQPAWTAVGAQWTQPSDDFDLAMFTEPTGGAFPTCVTGLFSASSSSQVFVEIMAGDFHFNPPGTYFARATGGTGPFLNWEWDAGTDVLTVNAPPVARTAAATDLLECWDVYLEEGQTYTVFFEPDGPADLSAYVFSNPSYGFLWAGGDQADLVTTEHAHYVAPVTGWYGVVVVKRNPAGVGDYRLGFYQAAVAADPIAAPRTRLAALMPNPAQRGTRIQYELAGPARVGFEITNVAGRRVSLIPAAPREGGPGSVDWMATDTDGRRLTAGVYFVRMMVEGSPADRSRLVLLP